MYSTQRVEYIGGSFFGHENDEPTRTLLSFFISSVSGRYEDLICFMPIVSLTAENLQSHFLKVLKKLMEIGFQILSVLTDGHRTNCRFFKELGGGTLTIPIKNPFAEEMPIFLLFNPVHLMKNFFNNFQWKR